VTSAAAPPDQRRRPALLVAAALKWVDRRPEVDALSGAVAHDPRWYGASDADRAALEWALRLGEAWGAEVVAVTAGPVAAEAVLREALAVGADRVLRVDLAEGAPSVQVAAALAVVLRGASAVCCGDWSLDRGSGAVPAYLADRLGAAQALGLVALEPTAAGVIEGDRRLDGGRRERLRVTAPLVVSVEGASARLRRAGLAATLAAARCEVAVVAGPPARATDPAPPAHTAPFRPRPRVRPGPDPELSALRRVRALLGDPGERIAAELHTLDPEPAADLLLDRLATWGYR